MGRPSQSRTTTGMVDAQIEVTDGVIEEEFELEMGDGGPPFVERALFAFAKEMWPVVEDKNSAIGKSMGQVTKAVEGGLVNIAIDADKAKPFGE